MKKLAVYSCITGAYDSFPAHPSICADADYYLFVGKGELPAEVPAPWKAIELDGSFPDTITAARYAKLHPHTLLSDYEYTLWMDANVGVASPEFFGTVEEKISAAVPVSGIMHPACDCAYEEGVRVVRAGRARPGQVIRILRVLRRNQFPHHFGMFETAVLLRSNTDARVRSLNDRWWALLSRYCRRDQLSFSYCLWKEGLNWDTLMPAGEDVRRNSLFIYKGHERKCQHGNGFFYRKINGLRVAAVKLFAR